MRLQQEKRKQKIKKIIIPQKKSAKKSNLFFGLSED
jgi:hypothetical protein